MSDIFFATLGQRPEAITLALDELLRRGTPIDRAVIIHTDAVASGIRDAYNTIRPILRHDYPAIVTTYEEVRFPDGRPLLDVTDQLSADAYYTAVLQTLINNADPAGHCHLLVAGGRKAMSIYAMLAASLLFRDNDRVWTILSEQVLVDQRGVFHVSSADQHRVQLVRLPVLPSRLAPGADPHLLPERRRSNRADFLSRLSDAERTLVEALAQSPRATNAQIAERLGKARATVETQLESIYAKLHGFLDLSDTVPFSKRQMLISLLGES